MNLNGTLQRSNDREKKFLKNLINPSVSKHNLFRFTTGKKMLSQPTVKIADDV